MDRTVRSPDSNAADREWTDATVAREGHGFGPHAMLVVDHFHVVQLANRAVTEVRRRMTVTHRGRRGRATDPEWQQRNRLTRSAARMRAEHVDRLTDTLSNLPAMIGQPILTA
ncbi:transposase [Micromonospora sp. WMMD1102]|uniref:transposase n=1 Tax=Micromonospora sp. WMMD1102 TaxID=3016105 RepID=UPI002414F820|nr:transposase [Micromonospora sp. WMMD1102]MDG4791799.1 transposase [Micromonospora sp. WMMD1102]